MVDAAFDAEEIKRAPEKAAGVDEFFDANVGKDKESSSGRLAVEKTTGKRGRPDVVEVEREAISRVKIHEMQFETLYRLATMPRRRRNEYFVAAFWATVTATAPGIAGYIDLMSVNPTNKPLDIAEVVTLAICVAAAIIVVLSAAKSETSEEYLNRICKIPQPEKRGIKAYLMRKATKILS